MFEPQKLQDNKIAKMKFGLWFVLKKIYYIYPLCLLYFLGVVATTFLVLGNTSFLFYLFVLSVLFYFSIRKKDKYSWIFFVVLFIIFLYVGASSGRTTGCGSEFYLDWDLGVFGGIQDQIMGAPSVNDLSMLGARTCMMEVDFVSINFRVDYFILLLVIFFVGRKYFKKKF